MPFFCHDETDRLLRVPSGQEAIHANGVTGMHSITIPSSNLVADGDFYKKVSGHSGFEFEERMKFAIGVHEIDLVPGQGNRPIEVELTAPVGEREVLPENLTHGARLVVGN